MQQRARSGQKYNPHIFASYRVYGFLFAVTTALPILMLLLLLLLFRTCIHIDNSHGITSHCIVVKVKGAPVSRRHNCIKSLLHFLNNIRFHAILT